MIILITIIDNSNEVVYNYLKTIVDVYIFVLITGYNLLDYIKLTLYTKLTNKKLISVLCARHWIS